ncbi:acyltransferase family protein [Demequina lignilytica]|uniref:Acyltransferase family protein n=1 Tax=Demequina lignilytica TaxID=3051663 RepID=A0AB35MI89_9MICO|nr:acyltransferase family protein [Demequina sp. SYSU T0a273]MDN4483467.1 acyltransferase family protein [Demequina sp. SYSU T0a273]
MGEGAVSAAVDATPDTRDRFVDLIRVGSLIGVVLGHFAMAAVVLDHADGTVVVANVLETATWTRPLTLLFQVMPLFFVVGGFAHATSWRSLRARGGGYADFVHARIGRLLMPTAVFVAVWMVLGAAIELAWPDSPATGPLLQISGQLLWFIGIYLIAAAFAPALLAAHERAPRLTLGALASVAVAVDVLRLAAGIDGVKWLNFAFVWLAIHQLGFHYADGVADRVGPRRLGGTMLGVGAVALLGLVTWGPYGWSMVSYAGEPLSNLAPPTTALLVFACAQAGLALLLRGPARRLLARRRAWTVVVAGGAVAMTAFLWHFSALVALHAVLWGAGVDLAGDPTTASFWWGKLAMLPAFLLLVGLLVLAWRRFDRPPARAALAGPGAGRATVAAVSVACAIVAMLGFAVVGFRGVVSGYVGHVAVLPMTVWSAAVLTALAIALARVAVVRRPRRS